MAAEVTDWISACANVAAAVGTVGALWVGAITLRRQVNDQHRRQASAVTVGHREDKQHMSTGEIKKRIRYFVRNDSSLPIYDVLLYAAIPSHLARVPRKPAQRDVLPPGEEESFYAGSIESTPYARFTDSSGVAWGRDATGRLVEIKSH